MDPLIKSQLLYQLSYTPDQWVSLYADFVRHCMATHGVPRCPSRQMGHEERLSYRSECLVATKPPRAPHCTSTTAPQSGGVYPVHVITRKDPAQRPSLAFAQKIRSAQSIARIRARVEKIFTTWKRSYHFRAMRWVRLDPSKAPNPSRGHCLQF